MKKRMKMKETKERMKVKMGTFIAFALVIMLLSSVISSMNVSALGVTPGRVTLIFEPNVEKEISFTLVNTEHKSMSIVLSVEGEMADNIILNQTSFVLNAAEEQKTLSYKVIFPSNENILGESGIKARIKAVAIVQNTHSGTSIGVNVGVEQQLYVLTNVSINKTLENVSEKLNVTKVFVQNYNRGDVAKVEIQIFNPKTQVLEQVYSTMLVYDKSETLRSQFNSTSEDIAPKQNATLFAFWDTKGFELGNYSGNLTVYYDNKTKEQKLMIQLEENKIEINIGEFEKAEEKPPIMPPEAKLRFSLIHLAILILIIILIVGIIVYFYLRARAKAKIKKNK